MRAFFYLTCALVAASAWGCSDDDSSGSGTGGTAGSGGSAGNGGSGGTSGSGGSGGSGGTSGSGGGSGSGGTAGVGGSGGTSGAAGNAGAAGSGGGAGADGGSGAAGASGNAGSGGASGTGGASGSGGAGGSGGNPTELCGCTESAAVDLTAQTQAQISFGTAGSLYSYTPKCIKVKVGTDVAWTGSFQMHPLNAFATLGTQPNPIPTTTGGNYKSHIFTSAGAFGYYCGYHGSESATAGGMCGAVFVVP